MQLARKKNALARCVWDSVKLGRGSSIWAARRLEGLREPGPLALPRQRWRLLPLPLRLSQPLRKDGCRLAREVVPRHPQFRVRRLRGEPSSSRNIRR